jgi:DNA-binding NarL/FixJ family response regulator
MRVAHVEGTHMFKPTLQQLCDDFSILTASWQQGAAAEEIWRDLLVGDRVLVESGERDGVRLLLLRSRNETDPMPASPRELAVLDRAALGDAGKVIAIDLGLSTSHVSTLISNALRRLGFRSRAELVWFCRDCSDLGPSGDIEVARVDSDGGALYVLRFSMRIIALDAPLTRSERAVVAAALEGKTNRQIARAFGRSVHTVSNQFAKAKAKLGAQSRLALIRGSTAWARC